MDLPSDIWLHIIQTLGQPVNPSAYRLGSGCAHALAQLCLVSRSFKEAAEPLLYSRPYINQTNLQPFTRTIVLDEGTKDAAAYGATTHGKLVTSLAIVDFNEKLTLSEIRQIASILYALRTTLSRLFFDVYLRRVDYASPLYNDLHVSMRYAMQGLSHLEEFCLTHQLTRSWDPMPWASAQKTLKRLVMVDVHLNLGILSDRIAGMEALEMYLIAFPSVQVSSTWGEVEPLVLADEDGRDKVRRREVVLAVPAGESLLVNHLGLVMSSEGMQREGRRWKEMFRVMELSEVGERTTWEGEGESRTQWFLRAIADGLISGRATKSWDEFVATGNGLVAHF